MKKFFFIFLLLTSFYVLKSQTDSLALYENNLQVSQYLYEQNVIQRFLDLPQLTDNQKKSLMLAIYYQFSIEDIDLGVMRKILKIVYVKDFSQKSDSEVEADFAKLIKKIDDSFYQKDYSYLKNEK